jgi:hypothetical protein
MNNWYPSNSIVSKYKGGNVSIINGTKSTNFQNAVNSYALKGRVLAKGSYGSIKTLGDKYVMKTMYFNRDQNQVKIFLNEVRVGGLPGIQQVGPKIYAFRLIRQNDKYFKGQYIMDRLNFVSLENYIQNKCPEPQDDLYKQMRKTIEKFWKITKGYHGDLHDDNIGVIPETGKVVIIDYGAHKKFKTNINNSTCFDTITKIINKEFHDKYLRVPSRNYYPYGTRVRLAHPKRGQSFRPNTNMLRGHGPRGPILKGNNQMSFMNLINPKNNNTKIKNYLATRRYMSNGRLTNNAIKEQVSKLSPSYLFMNKKLFNKLITRKPKTLNILKNEFAKSYVSIPKLQEILSKAQNNEKNEIRKYLSTEKKSEALVAKFFL